MVSLVIIYLQEFAEWKCQAQGYWEGTSRKTWNSEERVWFKTHSKSQFQEPKIIREYSHWFTCHVKHSEWFSSERQKSIITVLILAISTAVDSMMDLISFCGNSLRGDIGWKI